MNAYPQVICAVFAPWGEEWGAGGVHLILLYAQKADYLGMEILWDHWTCGSLVLGNWLEIVCA